MSTWSRILKLSFILFFMVISDALLSFWVPNFLERILGSAFLMGVVFSSSSVVGIISDLVIPQLLKNFSVKKLVFWGGILGIIFALILLAATKFPQIWLIIIAMGVWGIYYEFLGFARHQFFAEAVPLKTRASGWAILDIFRSVAYFVGPILAGYLIVKSDYPLLLLAPVFVIIGLICLQLFGDNEKKIDFVPSEVNLIQELSHFKVLFTRVWPVIILSIFMGLIDSAFWTVGATWGAWVVSTYMAPSLFVGFLVARWGIFEGKKRKGLYFFLLSGVMLSLLFFNLTNTIYAVLIFISSVFLSVTYPLIDAVYTDIITRMGRERKHLMGLSNSSVSLAYIIGPILSGGLASWLGVKMTFVAIGISVVLVSIILLFLTPKKITLPQEEIQSWGV